jgi:hypothetical protein
VGRVEAAATLFAPFPYRYRSQQGHGDEYGDHHHWLELDIMV